MGELRRRLADAPGSARALEQRLVDTQRSLAAVTSQNERLAQTLREARDQIITLKEEVDRLAQPPTGFGTFLAPQRGRLRRRVHRRPQAAGERQPRRSTSTSSRRGQEVMLNEALNVVDALEFEQVGEVVMFKEMLADGERALVIAQRRRGARRPARRAAARRRRCAPATRCCSTPRSGYVYERVPKSEVEELVLEEVPDIDYDDDRRPRRPDRADPRRGRAALPAPRPVQRAPAQAAQGRAALRPAGLRQDAHRQGGRQLAGQEGRRAHRAGGASATS